MQALKPETLTRFTHFGKLTASPNHTRFAVLASKANMKENTYHHTLYLGDEKSLDKALDLKDNTNFVFLNDDEMLVEFSNTKPEKKAAKNQEAYALYHYHIPSKKLKKEANLPYKVTFIKALSNDEILITISATPTTIKRAFMTLSERKKVLKASKNDGLYEDINQLPYYFNGPGFITEKRTYLGIYHRHDASITLLTSNELTVGTVAIDPSLKHVYFSGKAFKDFSKTGDQLFQIDLSTKKLSTLEKTLDYSIHDIWFLEGEPVILGSDRKTYGNNQSSSFYKLNNGLKHWLSPDLSIGNSIGSDVRYLGSKKVVDGNKVIFTVTEKDHSALYQLSVDGLQHLRSYEGSIDGLIPLNDRYIAVYLGIDTLQEIIEITPFESFKTRTKKNALLKNFKVFKPEPLSVDLGTHQVEGFVIRPKTKGKSPAILDIHGGPKTVYGAVYYHEMQVWASLGYTVFFCNPRGSDGKGDAFADLRGQYGKIDYQDFMAFTDHVVKHYDIDPKKLYITGGSYGGFMTNWALGQTDRFKAGVTQRSISNWLSFYGTSDIGFTFGVDQTGGHPLKDRELLWDQSPLKYALNIKTPLRFIHSDQDHRCPIEQAQQLYAVLRNEGVDTDIIWFKNENHELSRSGKPEARIKRLYAIQDWFKKYGGHA